MKKKLLFLALTLSMCLVLMVPALAAESGFTVEDGILVEYTGSGGAVTIPKGVTEIGGGAFSECAGLTSITIPNGVTRIGSGAFSGCTGLTGITIPASVAFIGGWMFEGCSKLKAIQVDSGNQTYASVDGVLFDKSIKTLLVCPGGKEGVYTVPDSVTEIGYRSFVGCAGLTGVMIGTGVTSIESDVFEGCTGLTDIYYTGTEAQWKAIEIGESNLPLANAKIHYNSSAPGQSQEPAAAAPGGFDDVKAGDYFADPVLWAVEKGITAGTTATTFSPNRSCTVAQILTFLWRANGSPKPAGGNPFTDVKSDDYYAGAAAWAYEKGMISGGAFGGNAPCTRSAAVTYMWKAAGSPSAKPASFTDIPSGAEYANAVAWAVAQGITGGTSATTFSPDNICTRGQIVTFLYRGLAG